MLEVSFSEKIGILTKIMTASIGPIIALVIIIFIGFLFITTNRHNRKDSKKIYILLYITVIIALLIQYSSNLYSLLNYFIDHVFIVIYFPNLAIYLLAIIITNILMWKSMFKSDDKPLKVMNTIAFCIIHYLFILLLTMISSKNLNIFELTAIYGNKEAFTLIELTAFTFTIWILLITVYQIIRKIGLKNKDLVLEEVEIESKYNSSKESMIISVIPPIQVFAPKRIENKKEQIDDMTKLYDSMLTVEDYKLLLDLLKSYHHKEEIKKEELEPSNQNDILKTFYGKTK